MTRKDYVALAGALKQARALMPVCFIEELVDTGLFGVDTAAEEIATILAADNPRFDRDRFLAACGVTQ